MTVRELYAKLNERIPAELSCEWDNDGLMCCPDGERIVTRVLVALDITSKTVDRAIEGGFDCIISHHPFIFKGLKSINEGAGVSDKAIKLIANKISAMSFHTRLDAAEGGVNDTLCRLLGIGDIVPIYEEDIPLGRVGNIDAPISARDFALRVKSVLGAPFVLLSDSGREVRRVAVLGGGGKDLVGAARASGADTFLAGRLDYHPMTDEGDNGKNAINLLEAGHFYTEQPICAELVKIIGQIAPEIECEMFWSNIIEVI